MLFHQLLQDADQLGLDQSRTPKLPAAAPVLASDPRQLLVVLQKEPQPLIAHIHVQIGPVQFLQFPRVLPSAEGVLLDLSFDVLGRVRQEDGRVGVAAAHLSLRSLQWREELGVDQRRLALQWVMLRHELVGDVASQSKVRILVDGAGDETGQCAFRSSVQTAAAAASTTIATAATATGTSIPQHIRKRAPKTRRRLYRRKGNLPNIAPAIEPKDAIDLIDRDRLPNPHNVRIHPPHVIQIAEQKRLLLDEIAGDDVLGIFHGQVGETIQIISRSICLLLFSPSVSGMFSGVFALEQKLFVVRHLNHQRTLERPLEPRREEEGDEMAEVHGSRGGSPAGVEIDGTRRRWFLHRYCRRCRISCCVGISASIIFGWRRRYAIPTLQQFANLFDIAMAEEYFSPQKSMQEGHRPPFHGDIFETSE
mmetsp:Transcript_25829/g.44110  ORF Transcript_25829/g.44110 Transcript_25829/m.44110 type:complete len:422 (+) Transcript_25829:176-1441(+)